MAAFEQLGCPLWVGFCRPRRRAIGRDAPCVRVLDRTFRRLLRSAIRRWIPQGERRAVTYMVTRGQTLVWPLNYFETVTFSCNIV